jgi:hypothetical protein
VLVTLKLYLSDGRERQLSQEVGDGDPATPREILERMSDDGLIRLGDRESCSLDAVERVELVPLEAASGPDWHEPGRPPDARLRDEDVSAALREQH